MLMALSASIILARENKEEELSTAHGYPKRKNQKGKG
jgi:hypothetical protein